MKNIHILQTPNESKLAYYQESTSYNKPILQLVSTTSSDYKYQNIYITSNEEIKEGDCVYNIVQKTVFKADGSFLKLIGGTLLTNQKIILTTDQEIIEHGIQAIDDKFLEWFVKNSSCEFVEYNKNYNIINGKYYYKIIIPKEEHFEEPKQKFCDNCGNEICCCILRKQETAEEVAERLYPTTIDSFTDNGLDLSERDRLIFINGTKWQQERSYNEEEVYWKLQTLLLEIGTTPKEEIHLFDLKKWFEQFKKK
jgi:hypothetical protein